MAACAVLRGGERLLKKARSLGPAKELGKQEQVQVITGLRQHYRLDDLTLIASVPRSVYYYRLKASQRPDRHLEVKGQIAKIFYQHKGRYGYRRVHLALRNNACYLNHKTVQRLMSQLGLKASTLPKRYHSYRGAIGKAAPNLLARQFSAEQVNQKWAADVTEFNVHGQKVYLSPVIDLCNQEIVSHAIANARK